MPLDLRAVLLQHERVVRAMRDLTSKGSDPVTTSSDVADMTTGEAFIGAPPAGGPTQIDLDADGLPPRPKPSVPPPAAQASSSARDGAPAEPEGLRVLAAPLPAPNGGAKSAAQRAHHAQPIPRPIGARTTVPLAPTPTCAKLLDALRMAGLLEELVDEELERVLLAVQRRKESEQPVALLQSYYGAGGDRSAGERRKRRDRFFLHSADEIASARDLVKRLNLVTPELGTVSIERIGNTPSGPVVLRSGDHVAVVLDDQDEDDGDVLSNEDAQRTVSVRGLVQAINVLLDRAGVRQRLVPFRTDVDREVYLGVGVSEAITLTRGGWLEDEDPEVVLELGAW